MLWGREGQPGDTELVSWGGIHHSILPLLPVGGQALGELPLAAGWGESEGGNAKTVGCDKGSLTGKAKPAQ